MFNVKSTRDWVTEANNKANVIRSFLPRAIVKDYTLRFGHYRESEPVATREHPVTVTSVE